MRGSANLHVELGSHGDVNGEERHVNATHVPTGQVEMHVRHTLVDGKGYTDNDDSLRLC